MTVSGVVKLSNFKLPSSVVIPNVVDGQVGVHSFRHIAADVLLHLMPYTAQTDMYSMAIAMYEAWFHTEAFLEYTFDRDHPKNTLKEFAENLTDPAEVLEKQVEKNRSVQVSRRPSDSNDYLEGQQQWFDAIRKIIADYKNKDPKLAAENWGTYLPTS